MGEGCGRPEDSCLDPSHEVAAQLVFPDLSKEMLWS